MVLKGALLSYRGKGKRVLLLVPCKDILMAMSKNFLELLRNLLNNCGYEVYIMSWQY